MERSGSIKVLLALTDLDLASTAKRRLERSGEMQALIIPSDPMELPDLTDGNVDAIVCEQAMLAPVLAGSSGRDDQARRMPYIVLIAQSHGEHEEKDGDPIILFKDEVETDVLIEELERSIARGVRIRSGEARADRSNGKAIILPCPLEAERPVPREKDPSNMDKSDLMRPILYRHMFNEMGVATALLETCSGPALTSSELRFVDANRAFEVLADVRVDDARGRTVRETCSWLEHGILDMLMEVALSGEVVHSVFQRSKDGRSFDMWAIRPQEGTVAVSFIEVTSQKKTERELRSSETLLRTILDTSPDGMILLTNDGLISYCSLQALEMLGVEDDEAVLSTLLMDHLEPEDRMKFKEHLQMSKAKDRQRSDRIFNLKRKDGAEMLVEINSSPLDHIFGDEPGFICSLRDATERIRLDASIRSANQKLNLLNSITRHDIMNQLTVLQGYLEIARRTAPPDELTRLLEKMDTAANNIGRQIEFTREYQFIGVNAPVWTEPSKVLNDVTDLLLPLSIRVDDRCEGLEVFADPLFNKVIYTLVDNSLRHGEGVTTISLSREIVEGELNLIYRDDGTGIRPDDKYRIFEKGYGKGTGLGLFLVKEILSITGATIIEDGVPGSGVRFVMTFRRGDWRPK